MDSFTTLHIHRFKYYLYTHIHSHMNTAFRKTYISTNRLIHKQIQTPTNTNTKKYTKEAANKKRFMSGNRVKNW